MKRRVGGFSPASLKVGRNGLGLYMAGNGPEIVTGVL